MFTCCKYSLSGVTTCSHRMWPSSLCWKYTFVSFRKFLPNTNSSSPPEAGHDVRDFYKFPVHQVVALQSPTIKWKRKKKFYIIFFCSEFAWKINQWWWLTAHNRLWTNLQCFLCTIIECYCCTEYHATFCRFLFTAITQLIGKSMFHIDVTFFQYANTVTGCAHFFWWI